VRISNIVRILLNWISGSPSTIFVFSRLVLFVSLPFIGVIGYGDAFHFYHLAGMGWPLFDYWVEFPPIFPMISTLLFRLVAGRESAYYYALALLLTCVQAANIYLIQRLAQRVYKDGSAEKRVWIYFSLLLGLGYGWWFFDPIPVFTMLLGLVWLFEGKDLHTGIVLALGALTKIFPLLVLAAAWRYRPGRRAFFVTVTTLSITVIVYLGFWLASPQMTSASLQSQANKGSWETVWALVDGNIHTGNFGSDAERVDPTTAKIPQGNPPRFAPWITLLPFSLIGLWLFVRSAAMNEKTCVAFLGLTWCVFSLWSPGWSPQWVLYFLPLILLALPLQLGALSATCFLLINLIEWPLLLSRGFFWGLWMTIPVRTLLIVILAVMFFRAIQQHSRDFELEVHWKVADPKPY
jgi:hypothetical protein